MDFEEGLVQDNTCLKNQQNIIYTGADTLGNENSYSTFPKPAQVVLHLARHYLNKGYHIVTDQYYSSVPLTLELEKYQTTTIVKNHIDLPDPIRDKANQVKSKYIEGGIF